METIGAGIGGRLGTDDRLRVSRGRSGLLIGPRTTPKAVDGPIDVAIPALLVLAVLIQGVRVLFGLPGAVELLADLASGALLLWVASTVLRARRPIVLPYLALALALVVVLAALGAPDLSRLLVSAKNFLFLPVLALALAALGPSERRVRLAVLTILALTCIEFGVTIVQSLAVDNVDLVDGTFGDYSGPSTAFALQAGACLALGAYTRSRKLGWLLLAGALPLASIWAGLRIVLLAFPVAGLTVAAAAWLADRAAVRRPVRTRPAVALAACVLISAAGMFAGYAVFKSSDFALFTDSQARSIYLNDATVGTLAQRRAQRAAVPGRGVQIKTAIRLAGDSPPSLLIGRGLGATTYAENLGIDKPSNRHLVTAGYMDLGTLLVELGWLGVCLVAVSGLALTLASIRAARAKDRASWTRALLVAYPGILVVMVAGIVHGSPFRNIGSATMFWVLTGLVLAVVLDSQQATASGT